MHRARSPPSSLVPPLGFKVAKTSKRRAEPNFSVSRGVFSGVLGLEEAEGSQGGCVVIARWIPFALIWDSGEARTSQD